MSRIVIIGAGTGGLTAAIRLAQRAQHVTVVEARNRAGGLAADFEVDGFRFDAGPYILLDRPGLEWAFGRIGMDVGHLHLNRIPEVYETVIEGETLRMFDSLDRTADGIESRWPGSGARYRRFIARMNDRYIRLQPLQCGPRPGVGQLVRSGAWRDVPFLFQSLGSILSATRLPPPVTKTLGIWTYVAGQSLAGAPAPLALVPAVIHRVGAYYPAEGIGAIPKALLETARTCGVEFRFGKRVHSIHVSNGRAGGIRLSDGEFIPADAVISNTGVGTYLGLLDEEGATAIPNRVRSMLDRLPLQSPGVCAYLAVKGRVDQPYLRFRINDERDGCRLLVTPGVLESTTIGNGWSPARLIAPMSHDRAESDGEAGQRAFLDRVLAEDWWRNHFDDVRVLTTRTPTEWGDAYHLFRGSMNPVMTAAFMRAGRLAHRSPWIRGLYLTGSATHPGQWVSFCAVSGVLTADRVMQDLER